MTVATDRAEKIQTFFKLIFGDVRGHVCLARIHRPTREFKEEFFLYPDDLSDMGVWVEAQSGINDVYYCPQVLREAKRTKESVDLATCAWADLDECHPKKLLIPPTITIESSPKRYQALWVFDSSEDPLLAEGVSRRIAYYHREDGADTSGWDLTQLLRVPFTPNHKYENAEVRVVATGERTGVEELQEVYPEAKGYVELAIPFPTPEELESVGDAESILQKHTRSLMPMVFQLFHHTPEGDWSKALWQLQMLCFEGGLKLTEAFVVASESACNKYERDGRPATFLWKEVCRSFRSFEERHKVVTSAEVHSSPILTDEERRIAEATPTFVEEYIEWAKSLGDAAWQYHQAGAFVVLSSLLAGPVRLPTSFGLVVPNLWFMILADTTLTRKTTAMDISIDLLSDINRDAILATDGSIEGLFTSLSMRPGKPSVFLRDEFSGLLEAMVKKDYYAGMAETLTKLYDGKFQKRVLRKEIIEVRDPVLIIFAGGIKTRILGLLDYEHVASGFLPRFIFITAESDVTRLRPLGPPTEKTLGQRDVLLSKMNHLVSHYSGQQTILVDKKSHSIDRTWDATLTPDAWARYNKFENDMLQMGLASNKPDLMTPTLDRLSKSALKAAVLISASRKLDSRVVVEEIDLVKALAYAEHWREHAIEVISNVGTSSHERTIQTIYKAIQRRPGILRSELMQAYHLRSREADAILDTLDQRGLINRSKMGRSERLNAFG